MTDPAGMDRNRDKMAERILHLTLEILFRLTGEDYTVMKKTSSERCQAPVFEGWGRPLSPITGPPPRRLIQEDNNEQKILELTYKIMELLTGEVPIRCQDVTIYFSMEEWEYLEGHKDLYKDVMMEVPQPLTSPDLSSERTTSERCPRPLLPQDCKQENPNVSQDHQGEDLTPIDSTETYVSGDQLCKEEILTYGYPHPQKKLRAKRVSGQGGTTGPPTLTHGHLNSDLFTRSSEGQLKFSDFKVDDNIAPDTYEDQAIIPDFPSALHGKNILFDPFQQLPLSDSLQTVKQNKSNRTDGEYKRTPTRKKTFSCSECGKCCKDNFALVIHERVHTGEKPFSCSECGKCFRSKYALVIHERVHTGEKPFSCSECGKCFRNKYALVIHERVHTGEKPYPCSECGKCFKNNSALCLHKRVHTGEKPYLCSECGKCFKNNSALCVHKRVHTGEKPYSCSECKKYFCSKAKLVGHQRTHTGEKPFSCSECGKCFSSKSVLVAHQRIHTGEKPYSCSECGKCFAQNGARFAHQKSHTGEMSFSCLECGKCFTNKCRLLKHQNNHTRT